MNVKVIYNNILYKIYNCLPRRRYAIKDFFKTEEITELHHLLIALRYLYVEGYLESNESKRSIYYKVNSINHKGVEVDRIEKFNSLIKSIVENGYNTKSAILIDVNENVFNGTHRLAICVYCGVKYIYARRIPFKLNADNPQMLLKNASLSCDEMKNIEDAYYRLYCKAHDEQSGCYI